MKYTVIVFIFCSQLCAAQKSDFEHLKFNAADSIALANKGESLSNLPKLTYQLTKNLTTEAEKFRAIFYWVCTNIENDYNSYVLTSRKRKRHSNDRQAYLNWNNNHTHKVFKTLVKHKKTACTGYAYLLKTMANLASLECEIVDGYGRTSSTDLDEESLPNHSWNVVKLNGNWYLCDPTWASGLISIKNNIPQFQQEYFDGYFLTDPSVFIQNHYPLDLRWALKSNPITYLNFIEQPLIYREAINKKIVPTQPLKMHIEASKNEVVHFSLQTQKSPENLYLILDRGKSIELIKPKLIIEKDKVSFHHNFSKKGLYDVHIKEGNDILASYVIQIKNRNSK